MIKTPDDLMGEYFEAIDDAVKMASVPRPHDTHARYVSGDKLRTLADNLYYLEDNFNMELPEVSIIGDKVDIICIAPTVPESIDINFEVRHD